MKEQLGDLKDKIENKKSEINELDSFLKEIERDISNLNIYKNEFSKLQAKEESNDIELEQLKKKKYRLFEKAVIIPIELR